MIARIKNLEGSPFEDVTRIVEVRDDGPGIRRRRAGRGFTYLDSAGKRVRSKDTLERIRFLAIPPAYRDVWICPSKRGHIQATGIDDRGRKQYRYHPLWTRKRQLGKYQALAAFAEALPKIRRRVALDLRKKGLRRERVLAAAVRLLEVTCLRIGNDEYAAENKTFGLTTLRRRHIEIEGDEIHFEFRGKGGKPVSADARQPIIAAILAECRDLPGEHLLKYRTRAGKVREVRAADVNKYLRKAAGSPDISAKEFRTWSGTVVCAQTLSGTPPPQSDAEAKRIIAAAVRQTAEILRNRPATCRAYYIHPAILDAYRTGLLQQIFREELPGQCEDNDARFALDPDERRTAAVIRRRPGARKRPKSKSRRAARRS